MHLSQPVFGRRELTRSARSLHCCTGNLCNDNANATFLIDNSHSTYAPMVTPSQGYNQTTGIFISNKKVYFTFALRLLTRLLKQQVLLRGRYSSLSFVEFAKMFDF